jgi:hypothetical protein
VKNRRHRARSHDIAVIGKANPKPFETRTITPRLLGKSPVLQRCTFLNRTAAGGCATALQFEIWELLFRQRLCGSKAVGEESVLEVP